MDTPKRRRNILLALITGLVVVTVSSPIASYAILGSVRQYETAPFEAQTRAKKRALQFRSTILQQRLGYQRALDDCVEKRRTDKTVECPDVNDLDAYRQYIRSDDDVSRTGHAAAPSLESKLSRLTARERAIVEQYAQRGTCPATLAGRGLYTLCLELVEELVDTPATNVRGFFNDRAANSLDRTASQKNSLRDRIRQAQESLSTLFKPGQSTHYKVQ